MAVEFKTTGDVQRGHSYWFETSDIVIDADNNGRHDLPNIEGLIADIERDGQLTPCLIRKDGDRPVMVEGHSRWRAIVDINTRRKPGDRLKVWCVYFRGNEIDGLIAGFAANRERNSLTPIDEGYFVNRLMKFGKTIEEIAKITRADVAWCKDRLALVSLVPEAQASVSAGEIKPSAAKALSKLSAADQRRALKETDTKGRVTTKTIKKAARVEGAMVSRHATPNEVRDAISKAIDLLKPHIVTNESEPFPAPAVANGVMHSAFDILADALAKASRPAL